MQSETRIEEILEFWFGAIDDDGNVVEDRSSLWWKKSPETDSLIRERFEADVREAVAGARDEWAKTARGCLALIVTLDQFPRNIYRDKPDAFGCDEKARAVALAGLERGLDRQLPLIQRVFYYLPLEHAETRQLQRRSVELFSRLVVKAPEQLQKTFAAYLDYAEKHQVIVDRFGRFPHRNVILGRHSTREELTFLEQPGSSF
jgi:uncharacterized protein (DUF924 family)